MRSRELRQFGFAARGDGDQHLAAVGLGARAPNVSAPRQPIDELYGGVVLNLKSLGEYADHGFAIGLGAQGEEKLVLLGFDIGSARGLLAEVQEAADVVTEVRKQRVVGVRKHLNTIIS